LRVGRLRKSCIEKLLEKLTTHSGGNLSWHGWAINLPEVGKNNVFNEEGGIKKKLIFGVGATALKRSFWSDRE